MHEAPQSPVPEAPPVAASERGWVWRSSVETAEAGKVSVMAIVETLLATGVYASIAVSYGTTHLVVSTFVAPLLLLRTRTSTRRGLLLVQNFADWLLWPRGRINGFVLVLLLFLLFPLATVAIKIFVTISSLFRNPLSSLGAIPFNWWRQAACLDSYHRVELLPGAEIGEQLISVGTQDFLAPQRLSKHFKKGNALGKLII
jgi:hypothetical protein